MYSNFIPALFIFFDANLTIYNLHTKKSPFKVGQNTFLEKLFDNKHHFFTFQRFKNH